MSDEQKNNKKTKKERKTNPKIKKERQENTWVNYVKEYCKKHNAKYRDALRSKECVETYRYEYKKDDY